MVHSQQVHKSEPEPLTNTLPGRDGYDIEIFGMEGVPTNALAEWKARKEQEAGVAAMAAAAQSKRPRHAYTVIPEADLMAALQQHKALMAARRNPVVMPPPGGVPPFPPNGVPPFPPPCVVVCFVVVGSGWVVLTVVLQWCASCVPGHAPSDTSSRSHAAVPRSVSGAQRRRRASERVPC